MVTNFKNVKKIQVRKTYSDTTLDTINEFLNQSEIPDGFGSEISCKVNTNNTSSKKSTNSNSSIPNSIRVSNHTLSNLGLSPIQKFKYRIKEKLRKISEPPPYRYTVHDICSSYGKIGKYRREAIYYENDKKKVRYVYSKPSPPIRRRYRNRRMVKYDMSYRGYNRHLNIL